LLLEHLKDDVDNLLGVLVGLAVANPLIKLTEDVDRGLEGLARDRRDALCSNLFVDTRSNLTRELVETGLFGLLERHVVGGTWEVPLDDLELTQNEVDLADLPLGLVVSSALIVLAAEERPVNNVASAGLVTTEMIGDDLAREILGILAGDTAKVLIVKAEELALSVRDINDTVDESSVERVLKLGLFWSVIAI
jgi:hypothetical protein